MADDSRPLETEAQRVREPDRRRHSRFRVEGQAEVFLPEGGLLLSGKILNLSRTGCYIETSLPGLKIGTYVEVFFVVNRFPLRVPATIAANRRLGAGIAFCNVNARQQERIVELIKELTGRQRAAGMPGA
ncbi:PilZ domain-containing protein [Silvibacterium acidisoli]|uniref:PilZ domain-containing protein n=1 Tax=Acidobacteriaceae bacterium ZG23-2 TaxID=2883246 RepID=UPI00406D3C65